MSLREINQWTLFYFTLVIGNWLIFPERQIWPNFSGKDRNFDSDWLAQIISTKRKCRLRNRAPRVYPDKNWDDSFNEFFLVVPSTLVATLFVNRTRNPVYYICSERSRLRPVRSRSLYLNPVRVEENSATESTSCGIHPFFTDRRFRHWLLYTVDWMQMVRSLNQFQTESRFWHWSLTDWIQTEG